jgi:serine/threonine protein kinase
MSPAKGPHSCISQYTLLRLLSEGRTSKVYQAQTKSGHSVALKTLREEFARSEQHVCRLYAQAKTAMLFCRPNIINVLEVGADQGRHYCVMEYHPRGSLARHLAEHGQMPEAAALRLTARLAEAIHTLHAAGFVHREITPSNTLLTEGLEPILCDFGRCLDRFGKYDFTDVGDVDSEPAYTPPELYVAAPHVEPTCDIYALGALLCECVAGRVPFSGRWQNDDVAGSKPRESLHFLNDGALLSQPVADLIRRCFEANPADRPASACEFALQAHSILGEKLPKSWLSIPDAAQLSSSDEWYFWTTGESGVQLRRTTRSQLIRFVLRGQMQGSVLVAPGLKEPFQPLQEHHDFASLFGDATCEMSTPANRGAMTEVAMC